MIPLPRVLFIGDPAAAAPWVGLAKKLARTCYGQKITSKTFRVAGVTIRVENQISLGSLPGESKVWIEAAGAAGGYQFIYSGKPLTYQKTEDGRFDEAMGSAVWVKTPPILWKDEAWQPPDWSKLRAVATGSTLEALPTTPPTPASTSMARIQAVKNLVQVNLIPEPVWHGYQDWDKPFTQQVAYSWSGSQGEIYASGFLMPVGPNQTTDAMYDLAPTVLRSRSPWGRMPDADWPNEACRVTVRSEQYGARSFLILVDARSRFYCWPDRYESKEWLVGPGSPYWDQAIKTNVPSDQARWADPPYPAWVHAFPEGFMRRDEAATTYSPEPRYVWRFHPRGTHVVGHLVERTAFPATVKGMAAGSMVSTPYNIGALKIYTGGFGDGDPEWSDVEVDKLGWAEFSLDIALTGEDLTDFSFGLTYVRGQQTDATHYPLAVGYLNPCYLGWASRGIGVEPGSLLVADLAIYFDDNSEERIYQQGSEMTGAYHQFVRQSWLRVVNVDDGETPILQFLVKDQPTNFARNQFWYPTMAESVFSADFSFIDLSTLSFVWTGRNNRYSKDSSAYYTFTMDSITSGGGRQRWVEMDTGVQYFAFGQKVYEARDGTDLGVLTTMDTAEAVEGMTRLSPLRTGRRRIYNIKTPYWSAVDLLSSFCYRMAHYLPSNSQPGPSYEDSEPCSSWTDWSGTTRTTTISFVNEIAPHVKTDIGTIANINPAYDDTYWNSFVIPKAWAIYQTTQAMRSAGDVLPERNDSRSYKHAACEYQMYLVAGADRQLNTFYDLTNINLFVSDYPIGAEAYFAAGDFLFNNKANFPLVVSTDGYYGGATSAPVLSGKVPEATFNIATTSGYPVSRVTERAEPHLSLGDAYYSSAHAPSSSQFQFLNIDLFGHIADAAPTTTHAALYGQAYDKDTPEVTDPTITVKTPYGYYIEKTYQYMWEGSLTDDVMWFYSGAFEWGSARLNGSALFFKV